MPHSSDLSLGRTKRGTPLRLTEAERATHIQVIGATGTGKSRLLEHMIRQDIARGRGLCLIDPHGTLYDRIERWSACRAVATTRTVHLVKPGGDWIAGFNPTLTHNEKKERWDLKKDESGRTKESFDTKAEATKGGALEKAIGPGGGSVKIQKVDGKFQEERTYPGSADPKKSPG